MLENFAMRIRHRRKQYEKVVQNRNKERQIIREMEVRGVADIVCYEKYRVQRGSCLTAVEQTCGD